MFTTSYKGLDEVFKLLIKIVKPEKVIEFGTQQGHSARLIAENSDAQVITYDIFEKKYLNFPYKDTHADLIKAKENLKGLNVKIVKENVFKLEPEETDVLHIDICNHYGNVLPLLESWQKYVSKMILLEGGVKNRWQEKYNFKQFNKVLNMPFMSDWDSHILQEEEGYALTVLLRK